MHDSLLLLAALLACVAGMGWLALSMDVHWAQVRGAAPQPPALIKTLRAMGAALIWCMALAGSVLTVALTLTWRASVLGMLVFWTGQGAR